MAVYKSKYTGPQVDALLDKINTLSNPLVIKGRVDTEQDLQNISNPQPGWMYLVGLSTDTYFKEFYYTNSNTWEYMGTTQITVDQTIVEDSENPVAGGAVYTALENKVDKETGKGLSTNDFTTAEKTKLDSLAEIKTIGTGLDLDSNGELTATGGGSGGTTNYNDLSNKPQINGNTLSGNKTSAQLGLASASDIPTVPITAIQKNGTGITPVSGTVNITVPTQASDINAATATQGDKADTAIQGIKVNNTTINPDANKVVNITVPTTAADVSALPDTTKYAVALSLTINSSTFVMTGQLKDQNGDNLGTAQTIDLPLESVVVGGSYNSQTKKVVLTLQNGNTIEFSVADLVSGLQTELSASNKLNPAYIDYDSTHRAVSDTEKSVWNGKQNALSSTQLDAVNSGIDSTKVAQIETNKNNILLLEQMNGAKNIVNIQDEYFNRGTTKINGDNGTITLKINNSVWTTYRATFVTQAVDYKLIFYVDSLTKNVQFFVQRMSDSHNYIGNEIKGTGISIFDFTSTGGNTLISLNLENEGTPTTANITLRCMIIPKSIYDAGFTDYQPYALSNAELTDFIPKSMSIENYQFSAASVWEYSGLSFTIPSGQAYICTASMNWISGQPESIAICDSSNPANVTAEHIIAIATYEGTELCCTGQKSGLSGVGGRTLYVMVKNKSASGKSTIRLTAQRAQ